MYIVKLETGSYLAFNAVMDKYSLDRSLNYTVYGGNGSSAFEQECRQTYVEQVNAWQTDDINKARLFDTAKSARSAALRGPFTFEVLEVEVTINIKD